MPGLESLRHLKLEVPIVNPGQVDPFLKDLLPYVLGRVDGGENPTELLALMAGDEVVKLAEGPAHLVESILPEVALDLDYVAFLCSLRCTQGELAALVRARALNGHGAAVHLRGS